MTEQVSRGRCPKCGTRISYLQACFYGNAKPFECSQCGQPIQKAALEMGIILAAITAFWAARIQSDSYLTASLVFVGLCVVIVLRSRARTPIELAVKK